MERRDIVVVHSGVQHSGELARVLNDAGRLDRLVTRLQVGEDAPRWWSAPGFSRMVERRRIRLADSRILRIQTASVLLERVRSRVRFLGASDHRRNFGRRVPPLLSRSVQCVIGTDMDSAELFAELAEKSPEILRVLDVSHPLNSFAQRLVRRDAHKWGLRPSDYDDYGTLETDQSQELHLADLVLAASSFTASSLTSAGVDPKKIRILPYAVEVGAAPFSAKAPIQGLRLLALGAVSERKGMTLLLRAMKTLESSNADIRLTIVGREAGTYRLPSPLPANVSYAGAVSSARVRSELDAADVLVLPSMCEGFGRTILEALARGCAVITTEASGGPDILSEAPFAPITILSVDERGRLSSVLERIAANRENFVRPGDATAAAAIFDERRYRSRLIAVVDEAALEKRKRRACKLSDLS